MIMKRTLLKAMPGLVTVFLLSVMLSSCGVKDTDIEKSIAAMPALSSITTTVKDGVVTLSGEVKEEAVKTSLETAVKSIKGVKSVQNNITIAAPPPPPAAVVIAADDPLAKGVTDAIKDFQGVKADVKDGVVTLTGEIKRASLQKLMMALHTLKPKKIDNQLTIK
jgi:hyperosmotically inducible protein